MLSFLGILFLMFISFCVGFFGFMLHYTTKIIRSVNTDEHIALLNDKKVYVVTREK